ncbi:MAG: ATP-binding protein [candidate division Zixibacteria bacterium]|nr:ATP-binding protein [candidate division Zixibacteria bacterium]
MADSHFLPDSDINDITREFLTEADLLFQTIHHNCSILEKNPKNTDAINALFYAVHSIKGAAAFLELEDIVKTAHKLETVLSQIRSRTPSILSKSDVNLENSINELKCHIDNVRQTTAVAKKPRMNMPFAEFIDSFRGHIAELAKKLGKTIRVECPINGLELSFQTAKKLRTPLIHLLRNACDHGIELPSVRQAVGKTPMGTISISASKDGQWLIIEISDDGTGLNVEAIKSQAIALSVRYGSASKHMSEQHSSQLIFESGISTASSLTELSGRGVGLTSVKTQIEELNGTIEVSSPKGIGTTFRITIPE